MIATIGKRGAAWRISSRSFPCTCSRAVARRRRESDHDEAQLEPPHDAAELLDTILEHAVDEEVDRRPSRTEDEWAKRVVADVHAKVEARRLRKMPPPPAPRRADRIPDALLSLSRDALIAELEQRRQA